jgi:hypothetical protein
MLGRSWVIDDGVIEAGEIEAVISEGKKFKRGAVPSWGAAGGVRSRIALKVDVRSGNVWVARTRPRPGGREYE